MTHATVYLAGRLAALGAFAAHAACAEPFPARGVIAAQDAPAREWPLAKRGARLPRLRKS